MCRLNFEKFNIKQKSYLDCISICLTDINNFTGDVIREAISMMSDDENLPVALIRTALLASKAHNDVKKYVLVDLIPKLIRRKIWITTPVHWEGVKMYIKTYATPQQPANVMEPTLRSILALPGLQLKSIIALSPHIKSLLSKLLKSLSTDEKDNVTSGKWIGLSDAAVESNESESAVTPDPEKAKILLSLTSV